MPKELKSTTSIVEQQSRGHTCVFVSPTLALLKNCLKQPRGSCCEFAAISRMNWITTAWCATWSIRASFCGTQKNRGGPQGKNNEFLMFAEMSIMLRWTQVLVGLVKIGLICFGFFYPFLLQLRAPEDQVVCRFLTNEMRHVGQVPLTVVPSPQHTWQWDKEGGKKNSLRGYHFLKNNYY